MIASPSAEKSLISQKEKILTRLREEGYRITSQRKLILEIILQQNCTCCKEIYYEAAAKDPSIGIATVYRMVNKLEEMNIINRRNLYEIQQDDFNDIKAGQAIFIEGERKVDLPAGEWFEKLKAYLRQAGYDGKNGISVVVKSVEC